MSNYTFKDVVILRGSRSSLALGRGLPLRLSVALGFNNSDGWTHEVRKLEHLLLPGVRRPDILVDLSTTRGDRRLYELMVDSFGGPVGTLPHYFAYIDDGIVDDELFLEELKRALEAGVSHVTLHPTVSRQMYELSLKVRSHPITSRGGGIVLADLLRRNTDENVFERCWPEIISLLREAGVVVSLGSAFRPARVSEAMDAVHRAELSEQATWGARFASVGVDTIREGIGHIDVRRIPEFFQYFRASGGGVLMALGPLAADHLGSHDPVGSAVAMGASAGATEFAVVQAISSMEHAGGVPPLGVTTASFRFARAAVDCVNIGRGFPWRSDRVAQFRESNTSCVTPPGTDGFATMKPVSPGCSRCATECPLELVDALSIWDAELPRRLPSELARSVIAFIKDLESTFGCGSVAVFGSTAKGHFAYARDGARLFVESDLELNVICDDPPEVSEINKWVASAHRISDVLSGAQPMFDVDLRFRNRHGLELMPYEDPTRRELYVYSLANGADFPEIPCSETDVGYRTDIQMQLESKANWLLLVLLAIAKAPAAERSWWMRALAASALCKLACPIAALLGVPFTSTPFDATLIESVESPVHEFGPLLREAWRVRLSREPADIAAFKTTLIDVARLYRRVAVEASGVPRAVPAIELLQSVSISDDWIRQCDDHLRQFVRSKEIVSPSRGKYERRTASL